jgi:branched-chain amino acid transport system substrate-binding protein
MRAIARSLSVLTCLVASIAWAGDKTDTVKIGVLTDMTGVFSDLTGNGSVEAAKMAIEKFGGKVNGRPVELFLPTIRTRPMSVLVSAPLVPGR